MKTSISLLLALCPLVLACTVGEPAEEGVEPEEVEAFIDDQSELANDTLTLVDNFEGGGLLPQADLSFLLESYCVSNVYVYTDSNFGDGNSIIDPGWNGDGRQKPDIYLQFRGYRTATIDNHKTPSFYGRIHCKPLVDWLSSNPQTMTLWDEDGNADDFVARVDIWYSVFYYWLRVVTLQQPASAPMRFSHNPARVAPMVTVSYDIYKLHP